MKNISILASLVVIIIFGFFGPISTFASTAPTLGTTSAYGIVSSTFTNSLNAGLETKIVGDVCYTTGPSTAPISISGATATPCTNGVAQSTALTSLNSQSCTSLGTNVTLSGTYTPGCYSSSGSMDIALSTTVTLNGAGVYIFRSGGALTTGENSIVALTGGATASDVFWTPTGAATLGANSATSATPTFVGTIIDDAGVTIGHFANILGRILAFGGTVTTDSNTITVPSAPVGPVFIDTNVNNTLDSGEQSFDIIQDAITAATAGDTIVIGAGTYTVTTSMAVSKTLTFQGDGSYPKIFFNVGGGAGNNIFNVTADNVVFRNLEIYSPVSTNGTRSNYAITYTSGSGLLVDDVKFHDLRRGVYVFGGNTFTVQDSQFSAFNRGMIEVSGGTGPFTITRNWFYDSSYLGGSTSAILTYRDNFVGGTGEISYNYIEGTRVAILYVPSTANAPTSGSLLIAHNTIDNTWTSTDSYYNTNILTPSFNSQGIAIYDPAGNGLNSNAVTVKDNIVVNTKWYGLHYNGGTTGVLNGNLSITNSLYWDNYWDETSGTHYLNEWFGTATNPQIAWGGGTGGGIISPDVTTKTLDPLFVGGTKVTADSYYALGAGSPACNTASDGQNMGAWQGTCPVSPPSLSTLHVVKLMVLNNSGIASPSDFTVHLKNSSDVDVSGSPHFGVAAPGTSYSIDAGTYTVSEDVNTSYVRTFSTDCVDGIITLAPGEEKICTIINTDIPLPPPTVIPVRSSSGRGYVPRIVPVIGISKVPTSFNLTKGPGPVTYNYTVWNAGGLQSLTKVSVVDDKCSPVVLVSGDLNNNGKLDPGEYWKYNCSTILSETTTNTAVVTGHSDDIYNEIAVATVISNVVVGVPVLPPLINIVKVPSRITPFPFGGGEVMYTYTVTNPGIVAISDITVIDDKCSLVSKISGDANVNNLLDPSETWVYTCRTNVPVSTRNVATARGKVNGFIALGYAFATVFVNAPGFPETGDVSTLTSTVRTVKSTLGQSVSLIAGGLRAGSMGNDVKTLQEFLISQDTQDQGMKKYGTDGNFGPVTKAALIKWQLAHDLVGDGIMGPKTRAKINTLVQ